MPVSDRSALRLSDERTYIHTYGEQRGGPKKEREEGRSRVLVKKRTTRRRTRTETRDRQHRGWEGMGDCTSVCGEQRGKVDGGGWFLDVLIYKCKEKQEKRASSKLERVWFFSHAFSLLLLMGCEVGLYTSSTLHY